jgi:hypothetical protein
MSPEVWTARIMATDELHEPSAETMALYNALVCQTATNTLPESISSEGAEAIIAAAGKTMEDFRHDAEEATRRDAQARFKLAAEYASA